MFTPPSEADWQRQRLEKLWPAAGFKWDLNAVTEENDTLVIAGWVVASPEERAQLVFTCDGDPCDAVQYPLPRPDVGDVFSYVPYSKESGFVCKVHLKSTDDPRRDNFVLRCVNRQTGESPGGGDYPYYYTRRRMDEILPEGERIARVAGFTSAEYFYLQGYNLFRQLDNALLRTVKKGLADFGQVLDWGCGCGRVGLHFRRLPSVQLTGVDVDIDNIDWCQKHMSFGRFQAIPLHPPMPFASESFDLIIGVSIFTHLREEVAFEWLAELNRIARRGSILLMSYHGNTALAMMGHNLRPSQFRQLLHDGFLDLPNNAYDAKLDESKYYRDILHQEFYIRRNWSKYFEIVDLISSGVGMQDLAVLRKK